MASLGFVIAAALYTLAELRRFLDTCTFQSILLSGNISLKISFLQFLPFSFERSWLIYAYVFMIFFFFVGQFGFKWHFVCYVYTVGCFYMACCLVSRGEKDIPVCSEGPANHLISSFWASYPTDTGLNLPLLQPHKRSHSWQACLYLYLYCQAR